jgi:tRNA dimethylallyltransferase
LTRHVALVGPTASGKSALAVALARELGDVEIVSLDSMQVYRGLDIGTAKPSVDERLAVPHHLIDVADPAEEWSVRRTQDGARDAIAGIEARGRRALLVGGTGLYVRAVVDDLEIPPTDAEVRAAIDADAERDLPALYERLVRLDPVAAARMEPGNRRRIVRALEVSELTGRPFSSFGPGIDEYRPPVIDVAMFGIVVEPPVLAQRIEQRFAAMHAAGLVDEVRRLAERPLSRTAREAIGCREILGHLAGACSLEQALDAAVRRTRRFARRQRVWFGRDPRIQWIDAGAPLRVLVGARS